MHSFVFVELIEHNSIDSLTAMAEEIKGVICGGISEVEDQERHKHIVDLCHKHIGKLENEKWEIVEIKKTRSQVVGGMKYFCDGKFRDLEDQSIYEAVITIYERAWENFVQVEVREKKKIE